MNHVTIALEPGQVDVASQKRTYTVLEIQDILSISRPTAYALIRKNYFRSIRVGGQIRVSKKSFDEWLNRGNGGDAHNGLPKVVFHSLRHSSITYKLKLNGGDMKSVQGDSGHAQLKMVADVYSHIIDEDRRLNAKRFEDAFYSGHKTEDELDGLHARSIEQAAAPQPAEPETDQQLLLKLLNNPEMAALLKTLAKSL